MKKLILLLLLLALTSLSFGKEYSKEYSYDKYDGAIDAKSNIEFHMESTKAGIFTSSFVGVVKKFKISASLEEKSIVNGKVEFSVLDMDTDSGARNSKMYEKCFSSQKFPKIVVDFKTPITINGQTTVDAIMNVRGKGKPIKIQLSTKREGKKFYITGQSSVTLSELEIPDPSIIVASVRDLVEVKFKLELDLDQQVGDDKVASDFPKTHKN